MMNMQLKLRCPAFAAIASIVVGLAGCQQLSGTLARVIKKNPAPQQTAAAVKTVPGKPLTAQQKADVQMAVARSLENQGQTEQAIKVYEEVVKKDGHRVDAYHRLAVLHSKKADFKAADRYYQTALKKAPKNAELLCDLGYCCYLQKQWKKGEGNLRRALAIQPELARAHNNLGLLLARTGRDDEALKEFARAGCGEAEARANLGLALMLEETLASRPAAIRACPGGGSHLESGEERPGYPEDP